MVSRSLDALVSSAVFATASLVNTGFGAFLGYTGFSAKDWDLYTTSANAAVSAIFIGTGVAGAKFSYDYFKEYREAKK